MFSYFPFGFEGRIWDLIVSVPDHFLSFYLDKSFKLQQLKKVQSFLCPSMNESHCGNRETTIHPLSIDGNHVTYD